MTLPPNNLHLNDSKSVKTNAIVSWSIHHPIGISLIMLTFIIFGLFSLNRIGVSLLPDIIYPDIRVRILDPGVSALQMEEKVTRQLEEQLAITENVTAIRSKTTLGRSSVDLSFPYGTDIDKALQDASSRLDRAKRFLPNSISPAVIYKRDPSQIPVMEYIISSSILSPEKLTRWIEKQLSKWLINAKGVASVEVGGGVEREIKLILKPEQMTSQNLSISELKQQIQQANLKQTTGLLITSNQEFSTHVNSKLTNADELEQLAIAIDNKVAPFSAIDHIPLKHFAQVLDEPERQRLSIRLNDQSGIKLSIQKQPSANTTEVVQQSKAIIDELYQQKLIPYDISISLVSDQSTFVSYALNNASLAALSGLILATLVVFLFLGNWRKTLIIASALPLAILITFIIMDTLNLSLNIMTLGGLALGIGLLVDNTIIMLENISRHISSTTTVNYNSIKQKANLAATEITSALVASTSTNLAGILPFLFIGGLSGLLFKDLITTIAISIVASLLVAMTLVPSYAAKIQHTSNSKKLLNNKGGSKKKNIVSRIFSLSWVLLFYNKLLKLFLKYSWLTLLVFATALASAWFNLDEKKSIFLPNVDEGHVTIGLKGEVGMKLVEMNSLIQQVESMLNQDPRVEQVFTTVGGFIFGRSQYERSNRGTIKVQLIQPKTGIQRFFQRLKSEAFKLSNLEKLLSAPNNIDKANISSKDWIKSMRKKVKKLQLTGVKVSFRTNGIRGIRFGNSSEEIELKIQGDNIQKLTQLGQEVIQHLHKDEYLSSQLKNLSHTYEDFNQEIEIKPHRNKLLKLDISVDEISSVIKAATEGLDIGEFTIDENYLPLKLYLPEHQTINSLNQLVVKIIDNQPIYLADIASIAIVAAPVSIEREQQQRINEVTASLHDDDSAYQVQQRILVHLENFDLPDSYSIYLSGNHKLIKAQQDRSQLLMALAIFLVFVVMAIQYESLRYPLVILMAIPFAYTSVLFMIQYLKMPLSMSLWLGVIMLTGIIVNNAIVLVEQINRQVQANKSIQEAIINASQHRFRPILMTTLSTVFGLMPLAFGMGTGTEILQPLAIVIVWGLSYSLLVSLLLIPCIYKIFHKNI